MEQDLFRLEVLFRELYRSSDMDQLRRELFELYGITVRKNYFLGVFLYTVTRNKMFM
jgi:hypothetical protein